jgi:hypothetical protein
MSRKRPKRKRSNSEPRINLARELRRAEQEMDRSKRLIDAGETFAAHKPSDWRLGGAKPAGPRS